jgi:hypothetical protein
MKSALGKGYLILDRNFHLSKDKLKPKEPMEILELHYESSTLDEPPLQESLTLKSRNIEVVKSRNSMSLNEYQNKGVGQNSNHSVVKQLRNGVSSILLTPESSYRQQTHTIHS